VTRHQSAVNDPWRTLLDMPPSSILWTVVAVLAIIALLMFIMGRR
jgi:hypothetical protein